MSDVKIVIMKIKAKPTKFRNGFRLRWIDSTTHKRKSQTFKTESDALAFLEQEKFRLDALARGYILPDQKSEKISIEQEDEKEEIKFFGELCSIWIELRTSKKKKAKDDISIITRHLLPFFGKDKKISEFKLTDIDRLIILKKSQSLSEKTVHNILTLFISMHRYSFENGWISKLLPIKKPKVPDKCFMYLKNNSEVERFLASAKLEGDSTFMLYLTAICTGLREGELAGLRWEDIDFDNRLIKVQRSFEGTTKNNEHRNLPIIDQLYLPLISWKNKSCSDYLFVNSFGTKLTSSSRYFKDVLKRILERAEFPLVERNGRMLPYLRFHDLRHRYASLYMINKGDLYELKDNMGHKSIVSTQRYAHLSKERFVKDYSRFSFGVGSAESDNENKIISINANLPAKNLEKTAGENIKISY